MTLVLPSFENQLRAYLTGVKEYDLKKIIAMHNLSCVIHTHVEKRIINLTRIEKICPVCKRNHSDISARVTIDMIEDAVADIMQVKKIDLYKKCRLRNIVLPRQLITYLTRQHTSWSFPMIAMRYNQDHTTCIASVRKISDLIDTSDEIKAIIKEVEEKIFL